MQKNVKYKRTRLYTMDKIDKIRWTLAGIYFVVITVICIVTNEVCHDDSSGCLATWWRGKHMENELSWTHDRGCFNMTLAGKTMFGDNAMTWSSLYFGAPVVFIRIKSFWFVLGSVWIAITSFIFHTTYSSTAHGYDLIGLRVFSAIVMIELLSSSFVTAMQTQVETIKFIVFKGIPVSIVYYIGKLQWEQSEYSLWKEAMHVFVTHPYRERSWTYAWATVPTVIIVLYVCNDIFKKKVEYNIPMLLSVLIFIGIGAGLLIGGPNDCGDRYWLQQTHFYGHFFIAIGLTQLSGLKIWKYPSNENGYTVVGTNELKSILL